MTPGMVTYCCQPVVVRARPGDRASYLMLLGSLAAWLIYTRFYWVLRGAHATLPACPFLQLTGHPCPFCGGTRSFAYVWNGDFKHAVQLYPLGPVLFVVTIIAIPLLLWVLRGRRDLRVPGPVFMAGAIVALVALAANWAVKLTLLPN
jgi:hypothetical protein